MDRSKKDHQTQILSWQNLRYQPYRSIFAPGLFQAREEAQTKTEKVFKTYTQANQAFPALYSTPEGVSFSNSCLQTAQEKETRGHVSSPEARRCLEARLLHPAQCHALC